MHTEYVAQIMHDFVMSASIIIIIILNENQWNKKVHKIQYDHNNWSIINFCKQDSHNIIIIDVIILCNIMIIRKCIYIVNSFLQSDRLQFLYQSTLASEID